MDSTSERVTVVHLARQANGIDAVRRFVDSYVGHDAGVPHKLIVLCKGFERDDDVRAELGRANRPFLLHHTTDEGVDIGAYLQCSRQVTTELVCFLNSFSQIRVDGWLAKLVAGLQVASVGLAGATGSYESALSEIAYRTRRDWTGVLRRPSALLARARELGQIAARFPFPPNPHVRTNAFVIRTRLFRGLHLRAPHKAAALEFESGYRSMTRQLVAQGLQAVVVGADGHLFSPSDWPTSETFRHQEQRNLLVHDNQTRRYQDAGVEERAYLGGLAWGRRARGV